MIFRGVMPINPVEKARHNSPRFFIFNGRKGCKTEKPIDMKKVIRVLLCAALLASGTSAVNAQGLGGLLKKGKEVGEKVAKGAAKVLGSEQSSSDAESQSEGSASQTVSASGIVISSPVSSFIEIEPVGLYGVSKSENFGDAYLVLKVKNLVPKGETLFGSSIQNQKMIAVDNNGKVYNIDASGAQAYDTPEGLTVRVVMDAPGLMFQDIRKDVDMMQQVKFGVLSDARHQGNVTLSNVPIFWDQEPE